MTKTKFKILCIAMVFVMLVSVLTACGKKTEVKPDETSSTTESTTEDVVEPIVDESEPEVTVSEEKESSSTTTKPNSSGTTTTTKPANKPVNNTTTTTRPANNTTTTTTQSKTAEYAYFTASTGEKIKYTTYFYMDGLGDMTCVGTPVESGGTITATYDDGSTQTWHKCSECGKYLCTGCVTEDYSAPCKYCGRTDCIRYVSDVTCPACHQFIPAYTCHHCTADC